MRAFPRAKPEETPEGGKLYLTVYPELSTNTGSISYLRIIMLMIISLISLTISMYTPEGVYCEIYPLLEGTTVEFNFNIPYLVMIYWYILY